MTYTVDASGIVTIIRRLPWTQSNGGRNGR